MQFRGQSEDSSHRDFGGDRLGAAPAGNMPKHIF